MKSLPLHIEIEIHKAQAAAVEALQSGASMNSVRLDIGRQLFLISKVCGKRLWHRAVGRLGLKDIDARRMINAAKAADRKAKMLPEVRQALKVGEDEKDISSNKTPGGLEERLYLDRPH